MANKLCAAFIVIPSRSFFLWGRSPYSWDVHGKVSRTRVCYEPENNVGRGYYFKGSLCAHNPNPVKIYAALPLNQIIGSGNNFAYDTTAQLSWHMQKCGLTGLLDIRITSYIRVFTRYQLGAHKPFAKWVTRAMYWCVSYRVFIIFIKIQNDVFSLY